MHPIPPKPRSSNHFTLFVWRILATLLLMGGLASLASTAHAQYMFLDSNGDGASTAADKVWANGSPEVMAVWLKTDHNRNGSLAVCNTGDGALNVNGYIVNVSAAGGQVSYSNFQCPGTTLFGPLTNSSEFTVGRGGAFSGAGPYKLMSVTITATSGSPSIAISAQSSLTTEKTSFFTQCSGSSFDNWYRLGEDWFDVDGLAAGGGHPPVIAAPATASGMTNAAVTVTGSASDPDAENVTLSQTNSTAFLTGAASVGPAPNPSLSLTGTPASNQSGFYVVSWSANDGISGGTAAATTNLTITQNRNPVITAPTTVSGTENTAVTITGSASDPDAQNLTLSQTNNAAFLTGAASAGPALNPSITLTGTPNTTQSGSYTVNWSANDGTLGTATTTTGLTIANLNTSPPVITAPSAVSATKSVLVSITGSASDPDGSNVTLSQTKDATFLSGPSSAGPAPNPSITLSGTPNTNQVGSYTINWSANDGDGGTSAATTAITVTSTMNRHPVITSPGIVTGTETTAVSITATASDPDAQTVTLSQTNNAAFLGGPASVGPVLNPSLTLTGTPNYSQSGSYSVNWHANDGIGGTWDETTNISIANLNRLPVITAPATVGGTENTAVSITGSASDPDAGDNTTLSQTNNAAFLTGPASAGPLLNPSITLTGTPNFNQSGSYTVSWTANGGGSATATTVLTIANVNQNPTVTAPATASGTENSAVSITGSASDPDAQNVTLSQTNDAAFLTGTASAGPSANPSITLTGTPNLTQAGSYTVNWSANDGVGGTAAVTTAMTIANLNQNPVLTVSPMQGTENTPISITASASDMDGETIVLTQSNNASFLSGPASAGPSLNPSITLTGTPNFSQAGQYIVVWDARANDGSGGITTMRAPLDIFNQDQNPVITAPATVSGTEGTAVAISASASDPDAEGVGLSETTNAPFLPSSYHVGPFTNPGITLTGTPNISQSGSYTVTWTANDSDLPVLTSTTTTTLTIADANANPAIAAPTSVNGTENSSVSITGSASDPDAQNVTLSQTNNATFLLGPASAGPLANPSINLTGTPNFGQAGNYAVNWSANDGAGGSATATTAITIVSTTTAVDTPAPVAHFALRQNEPNPFNPRTTIRYSLPRAERVQLRVFDLRGRLVATLRDDSEPAGEERVEWDGRDREGQPVASGVYLYRLTTEFGEDRSKRMVVLK